MHTGKLTAAAFDRRDRDDTSHNSTVEITESERGAENVCVHCHSSINSQPQYDARGPGSASLPFLNHL